jgi:hypothetical protein
VVRLAAALLAACAALASPAAAQPFLQFGAVPADLHQRAVALLSAEAGAALAPDAVQIAAVDLSGDGQLEIIAYGSSPAFCDGTGCEPRIYLFDGVAWRGVLEPGTLLTADVPALFSVVNVSQTGFSDLLVGPDLLVFDGTFYVPEAEPAATVLDTASFEAACVANAGLAAELSERLPEFCACMGDLFQTMGHEQDELDAVAAALAGTAALAADDPLALETGDYERACRARAGAG